MNNYLSILKTFSLLRHHQPGRLILIFFLTLLMGINTGFSIILLIPLLQLLEAGGEPAGGLALFFRGIADKTGLNITIESILIAYVVLLSLNAWIMYRKSIIDARYQQSLIYQLRNRLFRKIIMAEWPLLSGKSKTNHLQVLSKEVPNLANYYYFYLKLLTTVIITLCYTGYALAVSAVFTLIIVFLGVILFIVLRKFIFKAFHLGDDYVASYNRLLKYIDDFWQTVKIAKVHNSEDFYFTKYDEASSSILDLEYRMQRNWSLPQFIYRIAGILVLVLVVYMGYHSGFVPLTSFFVLILLFSRIFPQFVGMNTDINMIMSNIASVRMIMKLDDEFPEVTTDSKGVVESVNLNEGILIDNLCFSYADGETLFDNFSATIAANTLTGIVGESGIGKTTLIDLIAGLQRPVRGRLLIDGRELDNETLPAWKAGIGYLPQDSFFIDGTIRENLIWDSDVSITDKEITDVLQKVNAGHLPERFASGIDTYVVNYHLSFSGGECQRLALARVLLRKPRLLLLDEATSSLDEENEAQIMEVITRLKDQMTIICVTHRISLLPYFDEIIRL